MEKIWFISSISLFLVHCFMACIAITPTNFTTDQSALLSFKAHITFDPHNVLTRNWSTVTSCCNWIGVTCGARHQRVVALNLSSMDLNGTIPPHLGNLSFLTFLVIQNNRFHGHLPNELAFLRKLKVIDLGDNSFSGEVPLWFGTLPKLQRLYLFNNSFSGSLPEEMCNRLPELNRLYLFGNQFYGQIPSGICKCRQLQYLALSTNKFIGSIPREIGNLTLLKALYLGGNSLGGAIPSGLWECSKLMVLSLSNNKFIGSIPREIGNLTAIEELYLHQNSLKGAIPSGLWGCSKLMILSMSGNKFIGSIPREIGNLTAIKALYLDQNSLKEYGSEGIVSTRGDVYSYGILLMETFTRKKPTDEMFVGEMSLKRWVEESLPHAVIKVADANLLRRDEEHFATKKDCISSVLDLALECSAELPEERIGIKEVLATLNKIRSKFQMSIEGTRNRHGPR